MEPLNQMTLECFMNKSNYRKYLAKTVPTQQTWIQVADRHDEIIAWISERILEPEKYPFCRWRDVWNQFMLECLQDLDKERTHSQLKPFHATPFEKEESIELFEECVSILPTNPLEYWKMEQVFKKGKTIPREKEYVFSIEDLPSND